MDRRNELPYLLSSPRFWSNGFLIGGGRRHLTYKVGVRAELISQMKESSSICLPLIMNNKKSCVSRLALIEI